LFILLAFLVIGMVSAQSAPRNFRRNERPRDNRENRLPDNMRQDFSERRQNLPRLSAETVTVTGELTIARGMLAVKSGEITYLAMGLNRYTGFIESLKDGAVVTLEGRTVNSPGDDNTKIFVISKLTIGGKDYDLESPWITGLERMSERLPDRQQQEMQRPRSPQQPDRLRAPQPERPRMPQPGRRPFI